MYDYDDCDGFDVAMIIVVSVVLFIFLYFVSMHPFHLNNGRLECECSTKNKMVQRADKYNAAIEEWDKTVKEWTSGRVESL